jgi:hypothetical protein
MYCLYCLYFKPIYQVNFSKGKSRQKFNFTKVFSEDFFQINVTPSSNKDFISSTEVRFTPESIGVFLSLCLFSYFFYCFIIIDLYQDIVWFRNDINPPELIEILSQWGDSDRNQHSIDHSDELIHLSPNLADLICYTRILEE